MLYYFSGKDNGRLAINKKIAVQTLGVKLNFGVKPLNKVHKSLQTKISLQRFFYNSYAYHLKKVTNVTAKVTDDTLRERSESAIIIS